MHWKTRQNGPDFEYNIISAFSKYLPLIKKEGYRKPSSVWGTIAGELYANTLQFRKWLYNFWHEDRRGLRTKTILVLQEGETLGASKCPEDTNSSLMYDKREDLSSPSTSKTAQQNSDSSHAIDPLNMVISHDNNGEHACANKYGTLHSEKKDVLSVKNWQGVAYHEEQDSVSEDMEMIPRNFELGVRNSTLQKMLSTELQVSTTGEFRASCLPSFTITLCGSEWRNMYSGTSQSGLHVGWSNVFAEKLREYNKFCVFTFTYNRFKRNKSRKFNAPFWYGKARCKFNGCIMLYMNIKDKPKKEASTVRIWITVKGEINHKIGQEYKRHTRLPERSQLKKELRVDTPSQLRVKLIKHCDPDALIAGNHSEIKSSSVLQKISSEGKLEGRTDRNTIKDCINIQRRQDAAEHFVYKTGHSYLQVISVSPFVLHMYMEAQLYLLSDLQRAGICDLYLDATGSVVKRPQEIGNQILYYALCAKLPSDSTCIIPVAEMLASDQSTPTISHWLALLSRDTFRVTGHHLKPQKIECDHSWALIHAATEVFNHMTPLHYLFVCYEVCVKKGTVNFTIVHICAAHMMKLLVGHVSKLKLPKEVRDFFLYSFALLQNGKTIQECAELIRRLTMIFGTRYLTADCRAAISSVQHDLKTQKISVNDHDFRLKDDIVEMPPDNAYHKSPFTKLIPQENVDEDVQDNALPPNIYHKTELIKLLSKHIRTLPLWSGIMLHAKQRPQTRDSNSNAENWFRIVKSQVLNSKLHRRPAEFVEIMKDTIQARLRVAAIGIFQESNPKEFCKRRPSKNTGKSEHIPHPLTLVETWSKRSLSTHRKVPKYYQAPHTFPQKGENSENNCPPWNGRARLNRRRVVLTNTCTIDNLLFIIHMLMEQNVQFKEEIRRLQDSVEAAKILMRVNDAFLERRWGDGKMEWLLQFEQFKGKSLWDCYGTEEEMVTSRLYYFWNTVQYSTCDNQDCSKKEYHTESSEIVVCLSNGKEVQEAVDVLYKPSSYPCTMHFVERKSHVNDWNEWLTSHHGTRITLKKCKGTRQLGPRSFVNGLPCMLIITVAVKSPYTDGDQFDPRSFPGEILVHSIKYKVVGITYNMGKHFICFHKFGKNGNWHLYDGLEEKHNPGHGNTEATEGVFNSILKRCPLPNHIVAERQP